MGGKKNSVQACASEKKKSYRQVGLKKIHAPNLFSQFSASFPVILFMVVCI